MGIFNTAKSNLPSSDVPNFIEIWMIFCILFILGAFTQSTFIFLILRSKILEGKYKVSISPPSPSSKDTTVETMEEKMKAESNNSKEHVNVNSWMGCKNLLQKNVEMDQDKIIEIIDFISFVFFSTFFLLFNVFFWSLTMT